MSGISGVYILDNKKRVLISRDYLGDLPANTMETLSSLLMDQEEHMSAPLMVHPQSGLSFFYKRVNNVMLVLVSRRNSNAITMFTYLYKALQVLLDYFKELDEETVRDNFVIIYELLDEMMDNGYPQTTESKVMASFITTEKLSKANHKQHSVSAKTMTNVVSWRAPDIYYKNNSVYLDIIENVNMQIASSGSPISSEIQGKMVMKTQLTGMPELKLGINDKVLYEIQGRSNQKNSIELNDLKFHSCVRLGKFESERLITFIPPDGEFQLMSYRLETAVKPLIMVTSSITYWSETKLEMNVIAKSNFKSKCIANDVSIQIPLPSDSQNVNSKTRDGQAVYNSGQECLQWTMHQFQGNREMGLKISISLPSVPSANREVFMSRPIELAFEIPYFTVSGILIRYLKIEDKSNYKASPFVRYITKNGKYYIRTNYVKHTLK